MQALALGFADVISQHQIQKVVIVGRRGEGKLARVSRLLGIFRNEPGQQVEHVIGGQMRTFARESDRQAQFKEAQTLGSCHAPQLFGCFAVKWRFRIDKNVQQTWLVNFVDRVKNQLHPVGQELFKRRVDGIVDPAQTADRLTFAGGFQRQTRRTVCAHGGFTLQ